MAIFVSAGAAMGLFVSPRVVGYIGATLFGLAILGLVVSASLGRENWTFLFGMGVMATPLVAGMAFVGSMAGAGLRRMLRGRKSGRP